MNIQTNKQINKQSSELTHREPNKNYKNHPYTCICQKKTLPSTYSPLFSTGAPSSRVTILVHVPKLCFSNKYSDVPAHPHECKIRRGPHFKRVAACSLYANISELIKRSYTPTLLCLKVHFCASTTHTIIHNSTEKTFCFFISSLKNLHI